MQILSNLERVGKNLKERVGIFYPLPFLFKKQGYQSKPVALFVFVSLFT